MPKHSVSAGASPCGFTRTLFYQLSVLCCHLLVSTMLSHTFTYSQIHRLTTDNSITPHVSRLTLRPPKLCVSTKRRRNASRRLLLIFLLQYSVRHHKLPMHLLFST